MARILKHRLDCISPYSVSKAPGPVADMRVFGMKILGISSILGSINFEPSIVFFSTTKYITDLDNWTIVCKLFYTETIITLGQLNGCGNKALH